MSERGKLIERVRERYTRQEPPPCRVCGAALTIGSAGGGSATKWVCSAAANGPMEKGWDEHYSASEWLQYHPGDEDVLSLVEVEAEIAAIIREPGGELLDKILRIGDLVGVPRPPRHVSPIRECDDVA